VGWEFAALLVGALLLSLGLGMWQQLRYSRAVNAMAADHRGAGRILVTGRGQGRLKGTIAVLVVDDAADEVIAAQLLHGSTVFAGARPAPALLGPVASLHERSQGKQLRAALDQAVAQLHATRARTRKIRVPQGTGNTTRKD
jgi:glucitol operon activator protein